MIELLDLDGEVLHGYLAEVTAWVRELTVDRPPVRIVDLGAGTGTGALALAERFPAADVTALDVSPEFLEHLKQKVDASGLADRVHLRQADLDMSWPVLDPADLIWASLSLHHMADPARVLTDVLGALRPGGLLVVAELNSFPRFLPDDLGLGAPGLEARCLAALAQRVAEDVPHLGADWGTRLTRAGFVVEAERPFSIVLTPPLPAAAARYAQASLRRMRTGLDGLLSADDLATLDQVITSDGPEGVRQRQDLSVRAERTVWVARRP